MADTLFDDDAPPAVAPRGGFRLQRLEVWNWGTFHGKVWAVDVDGQTALLTGDIGSGKSTLVDALTTLLVPAQRIAYNKAAGAELRERTLRTYVLGYYKNERNDVGGSKRPAMLRDERSVSVILGVFADAVSGAEVTLAQVFFFADAAKPPQRLYVGAERRLSIAEHFGGFGNEITGLRKQLRAAGAEVHDSFPPYGGWFRRRLGIGRDGTDGEQALELFHQTVSMKQVGNLTDFVRAHMLDATDVASRIAALLTHFDDLNRAHEAVLAAKRQMELLRPIVDDCDEHDRHVAERTALVQARDALRPWFAGLRLELLRAHIDDLRKQEERVSARIRELDDERTAAAVRLTELQRTIADSGGNRLAAIDGEIERLGRQRDAARRKATSLQEACAAAGLALPTSAEAFAAMRHAAQARREEATTERHRVQAEYDERYADFRQGRQECDALAADIESLRRRRSNIPREQVELRDRLAAALGLSVEDLPFAGELLQVREDERAWEGAAERVLRPFGLSLLVADDVYRDVQRWVDDTHLGGRLVYFRVRDDAPARHTATELHRASLARKIEVHPRTPFRRWVLAELARRFDLACCDGEQFLREPKAVTRQGQVKGADQRHEKNDRFAIDDRRQYVLGWSNAAKLAALEEELAKRQHDVAEIGRLVAQRDAQLKQIAGTLEQLAKLDAYEEYAEVDVRRPQEQIDALETERRELLATSDVLQQLRATAATIEETLDLLGTTLEEAKERRAKVRSLQERYTEESEELADAAAVQVDGTVLATLLAVRTDVGLDAPTLRSCEPDQTAMREQLQRSIDAEAKNIDRAQGRALKGMHAFAREFPAETAEVDASVEAADEYRSMLARLAADDLPRYEARFRELLTENTIREIVSFSNQLAKTTKLIQERVEEINRSLHPIDYDAGRFIRLEMQPTDDAEVRQFRVDLRACAEGTLGGIADDAQAELKFLQIRAIIDRFRGREGTTTLDERWTEKVTDVRNWFEFAASERWRETGDEHEFYSDSSGKSGGQKEKLAYTVLAASLAYQFGLDSARGRSFRFVVIDEAFGRGSSESARYGLQLFERLDLQLLVVTPLQKIHVIEPFVRSVCYVSNVDGKDSQLRNLPIEEFRAEKARRAGTVGR